jgi:acylglycerol lipase
MTSANGPKRISLSDDHPVLLPKTQSLITRGIECALYKWLPPTKTDNNDGVKLRGVAVVYHGFGAHSLYPTVRYASSLLAENGLIVYGLDFPGHGASPGKKGLLTGANNLIEDGVAVAKFAQEDASSTGEHGRNKLPLFLVGSSMGGAIALAVADSLPEGTVNGVIMMAPMLSLRIGGSARTALNVLATIPLISTLPIIPHSATDSKKQYRDAERRAECDRNTLTNKCGLRPISAFTCIEITETIQKKFAQIKVAFLCMVAEEDVIVDNIKTQELMKLSPSKDKTLKTYPALHGLLCEPAPLLGIIEDDLIQWLVKRCP